MKILKWLLVIVAGAIWMGWIADEQSALETAWGKPMTQNQEWRW